MNVLVNGISAKVGGGLSVLNSFLDWLLETNIHPNIQWIIIVPESFNTSKFTGCTGLSFVSIGLMSNKALLPLTHAWSIPKIVRNNNINAVINFSDLPVRTKASQLQLFDWPYPLFPELQLWKIGGIKHLFIRIIKLAYLKLTSRYVDLYVLQGESMGKRFERFYPGARYKLIPSPFEIRDNIKSNFDCSQFSKLDLLCLSAYYPHKNLEILIKVSQILLKNNVQTRFILTLSETDQSVKKFLAKIREAGVDQYFHNIGVIDRSDVPIVFKQVEALILPTLMETFCLPLYEAMSNGLPVLVSDIDFAHDACGESGWYFDPTSAESIAECIMVFFSEGKRSKEMVVLGLSRTTSLPTPKQVYDSYLKEIMSLIDENSVLYD